jgi:hypothetical protein
MEGSADPTVTGVRFRYMGIDLRASIILSKMAVFEFLFVSDPTG